MRAARPPLHTTLEILGTDRSTQGSAAASSMSQTRSLVEAATSSVESPASSCVSSEAEEVAGAAMAMVVAGCPQCLMYVMLTVSKEDMKQPKCPRCNNPVLLHFHNLKRS